LVPAEAVRAILSLLLDYYLEKNRKLIGSKKIHFVRFLASRLIVGSFEPFEQYTA